MRNPKPPTRIKLSPIGRRPKHRKREPYDARTLRFAARVLHRSCLSFQDKQIGQGDYPFGLREGARGLLNAARAELNREASAIERKGRK